MADDSVEAARRRQNSMLRRSSYFPAANLRQFEGTELSPPGAGTYYNPERYRGFSGNIARVQRSLADSYQSDLAFNAMANPNVARSLEAERIGAQYGAKSRSGQLGYQTVNLPSGGTTLVSDAVAKRLTKIPGYNIAGVSSRTSPAEAYQLGFTGQPSFANVPSSQQTPYQRSYLAGYQGGQAGRETGGVTMPTPTFGEQVGPILTRIGTLGYNAIASLFKSPQPSFNVSQNDRGSLLNEIDGTFYGGGHTYPTPTPTPTPARLAYNEPRSYFE